MSLESQLAHSASIQAIIRAKRDEIKAVADALFAPHNRPGGHEIETSDGVVDAYLEMTGPDPMSVEYGHFTPPNKEGDVTYVEGLHVMSRAARA